MNQGIMWTVIIILILVIIGLFAWNVQTKPTEELPSPMIIPTPVFELTPEPTLPPPPSPTPSVTVSAQEPGRSVTIDSATLTANGFIVIHSDKDGQPGLVIGDSDLLAAGTHAATTIKLTRAAKKGETLYAMLHTDVNGNGVYEFPGPDIPTTDVTRTVVSPAFTIGTPSPSPAVPSPTATPITSPVASSPSPAYTY